MGTTQNLAAEYFKSAAGIDAQVVPFNGTPPVIAALRGGSIDAMVDILGPLMPQISSKALRPIALLAIIALRSCPRCPQRVRPVGRSQTSAPHHGTASQCQRKRQKDIVARLNRELVRIPRVAGSEAETGRSGHSLPRAVRRSNRWSCWIVTSSAGQA